MVRHTYIEDRDDIVEGEEYRSVNIRRVIWKLAEGDVIEVEPSADSYPTRRLTVTSHTATKGVIAEDDGGNEYYVVDENVSDDLRYDGDPWLRSKPGYDSKGRIQSLTVVRVVDE